ncbi:MAG: hypothetical protein ABJB33_08905 [Gemmatimonadota bacterium]
MVGPLLLRSEAHMPQIRYSLALVGVALFATPAVARAQKLEITPFFASHYSLSPYFDEKLDFGGGLERVTEGTGNGPAFGVRATYWLSSTLGIEVEGAFSEADQINQFPDRDASVGDATGAIYDATVTMVSGRIAYRPRRSNLRVFAGVSQLTFGGDVYDYAPYNYTELSTIGGVIGFGVRAQATRSLSLDIAVEAYIHSLDRGDGPYTGFVAPLTAKAQQEVLVTVGVPIKLLN